jgi:hypothetical protein
VRWSELPLARVEIELAKLGTTAKFLVWFGDDENLQPVERSAWQLTGRTPEWRRLPRLDEGEPAAEEQPKVDERTERWRIPTGAYWFILEQRVKNGEGATVHGLSEQTRVSPALDFVGRKRVRRLTDWVDANPERARRAFELHDIPAEFRATSRGVLVPRLRNPLR